METTSQGIVLRNIPYAGSSAVVAIYTRRYGHTAFMAKGMGRKGGAISKAALQPLTRVEVLCSFRENRQIQTLQGLRVHTDAAMVMQSPEKSAVAMFLAEVLYKTLREQSTAEDLFDFIDEAVAYFVSMPFQPDFHLIFLMHLTRYFGFFPSGKYGEHATCFDLEGGTFIPRPADKRPMLDGESAAQLSALVQTSFGTPSLGISNADRRTLLADVLHYFELQLEGMGKVKSLAVLTEVFS